MYPHIVEGRLTYLSYNDVQVSKRDSDRGWEALKVY
jgi:hypothetical protein